MWTEIASTNAILIQLLAATAISSFTALEIHLHGSHDKKLATSWKEARGKLIWLAASVLVPELSALTAFFRFLQARKLSKELQSLNIEQRNPSKFGSSTKPDAVASKDVFTLQHAFLIQRGGCAIRYTPTSPGRTTRLQTLSPDLVKSLAREDIQLIQIALTEVDDMNLHQKKSNTLLLTTVVMQLGWLILQIGCRWASGLPIAILELTTLAHAFSTLLLYFFWTTVSCLWKLPQSPVRIGWSTARLTFLFTGARRSRWQHYS